jgi:hypothetical protein
MNGAPADSTASGLATPNSADAGGWQRRRWLTFIVLVFAAQVGFIFALGERHFAPPRTVANVPKLALADDSDELLALNDPTLFALPHADDFAAAARLQTPVAPPPLFRRAETPGELPLDAENLGAAFSRFMQTNRFAMPAGSFKPEPQLSEPVLPLQPVFADASTLQIEGGLARRKLLTRENLPSWPWPDVIAPSKVQVLVNAAGDVVSAVLLPPDSRAEAAAQYDAADANALALARAARFAPAPGLTDGRMVFVWHTVAPPATNSPAAP